MGTKLIIKGADFRRISAPVITVSDAGVMIIIAKTGATIKYTLDGSTPSANNGTTYSSPVTLDNSCTIKAIALLDRIASNITVSEYVKSMSMVLKQGAINLIPTASEYGKNVAATQRISSVENILIPNGVTIRISGLQDNNETLRVGYIYYRTDDRVNPNVAGNGNVVSDGNTDYFPINIGGGNSVEITNNKGDNYYFGFVFARQDAYSQTYQDPLNVDDFTPLQYTFNV